MRSIRGILAVCAVVMLTTGCGEDGAAGGSTTTTPRSSTTRPATTSTTRPAASSTTTSTPRANSTSTSTSTSTTLAQTTATATLTFEEQIEQAIQDYLQSYRRCVQAPAECVTTDFLAPDSEALTSMNEYVGDIRASGVHLKTGDETSYALVLKSSLLTQFSATASTCVYDAAVLLGRPAPGGTAPVVNDEVATVFLDHELRLVNGVWLVSREVETRSVDGMDLCSTHS